MMVALPLVGGAGVLMVVEVLAPGCCPLFVLVPALELLVMGSGCSITVSCTLKLVVVVVLVVAVGCSLGW